jgi:hypothetical protein
MLTSRLQGDVLKAAEGSVLIPLQAGGGDVTLKRRDGLYAAREAG